MKKTQRYGQVLRTLDPDDRDAFLLQESGLPGRRANLELAYAVADEGDERAFRRLLSWGPDRAPTNSPHEFLVLCGAIGLGQLLALGQAEVLEDLRICASDPRWRTREGVGMALQRWGKVDMEALFQAMQEWSGGSLLERRAAAVGG